MRKNWVAESEAGMIRAESISAKYCCPADAALAADTAGAADPAEAAILAEAGRVAGEIIGAIDGEDRERLGCPSCGHIAYVNPRLVVTVFPITEAGEIVLIRRGIEPGLGSWAQPGGFLEEGRVSALLI